MAGYTGTDGSGGALRRTAGVVGRAVPTCPGAKWAKRARTARPTTPWSSGRRMGVAPGFEREVTTMIDSVLNLLFRCPHKRLTRPVTPIDKDGKPHGDTYLV